MILPTQQEIYNSKWLVEFECENFPTFKSCQEAEEGSPRTITTTKIHKWIKTMNEK